MLRSHALLRDPRPTPWRPTHATQRQRRRDITDAESAREVLEKRISSSQKSYPLENREAVLANGREPVFAMTYTGPDVTMWIEKVEFVG